VTRRGGIVSALTRLLRSATARDDSAGSDAVGAGGPAAPLGHVPTGRGPSAETVAVDPPGADALQLSYAPDPDGAPDAGEIVWTWVPYVENDGRGKDRPVLVIARQSDDRVFAVRLTSRSHVGDQDFLAIGAGPWDSRGRPSWVDIEQLYSVHSDGMRREASALDRERFVRVADALSRRYGWELQT
jgi:hypothetical protein